MKPAINKFPKVDFNYHSIALDGFNGRCAKIQSPSFHTISRDYFATEEPNSFLRETAVFTMLMITAVLPMVSGVDAIIGLFRVFGTL